MNIEQFNGLSTPECIRLLLDCCYCTNWAETVVGGRPYSNIEALTQQMGQAWAEANEHDVIQAFSHHPKIGDVSALRDKFAPHANAEQGQISETSDTVLQSLKTANDEYFNKFGFIFIVCATGKSAEEMLALLMARLPNSREQELQNGAREQGKITLLRLNKIFSDA